VPYPLLATSTVHVSQGVSTPDIFGSVLRVEYTRETFRTPLPATARVADGGIAFGPALFAPPAPPDVVPGPVTGQLWPRGTP
jgi:hypothetical protein